MGAALFGEDGDEAELRALADRLGIADRVEFRGFRSDVATELERLDVFVHASVVPEPFGQVILEAMAAGVPAVAAAGGGASEIATDGESALLHPPGDVEALAQALRQAGGRPGPPARAAGRGRPASGAGLPAPRRSPSGWSQTYDAVLEGLPLPAGDAQA